METIKIQTKNNGYVVQFDYDAHKEYVYKSTEVMEMLEFVGRHIFGRKVKVVEN